MTGLIIVVAAVLVLVLVARVLVGNRSSARKAKERDSSFIHEGRTPSAVFEVDFIAPGSNPRPISVGIYDEFDLAIGFMEARDSDGEVHRIKALLPKNTIDNFRIAPDDSVPGGNLLTIELSRGEFFGDSNFALAGNNLAELGQLLKKQH